MKQYRPKNVAARELFRVADHFLGHDLQAAHAVTGVLMSHYSIQLLGNSVLVYDFPKAADEALQILAELDAGYGTDEPSELARETREYRARFASLRALFHALGPFRLQIPGAGTGGAQSVSNVSMVEERNVIVLHDSRERVAEMLEVLRRIDVPAPQVLVTCYLVRVVDEAPDRALPAELVRGMRELVGAPHLERLATGMLRTSVNSSEPLSILLDSRDHGSYDIALALAAYDETERALTLANCQLVTRGGTSHHPGTVLFRTSTRVPSGEFVVLGATGVAPIYVVLHCQPLAR